MINKSTSLEHETSDDVHTLPEIARMSIAQGLSVGRPYEPDLARFHGKLIEPGAAFVTLKLDGKLRGCVGSVEPRRPLVTDVANNAHAAAFGDARFPPLKQKEFDRLKVSVSILGPLSLLPISDEEELLQRLVPGRDGLVLSEGTHRALFLPQVWEMLPQPKEFVQHLKLKAGLPEHHWSNAMVAHRFEVSSVGDPET